MTTAVAPRRPTIEYGTTTINAFKVDEQTDKGKVKMLTIEGRKVEPSQRFWTSLCSNYSNYGLSTKLFKLFNHAEVFNRITQKLGGIEGTKDRLRFTLENRGAGFPKLLAVTNPNKPLVQDERIQEVLKRYGATNEYAGGIVRSTHQPSHTDDFQIAGDSFTNQYVMETPIDGFGKPLIYLSLLRQICTNGMVGYARAFRTELQIGRGGNDDEADTMFSIQRALDSFNNEEGYGALRSRFESATQSWASVYETTRVSKVLNKMGQMNMFKPIERDRDGSSLVEGLAYRRAIAIKADDEGESNPTAVKIQRAFTGLVGDLCSVYGVVHVDAISQKRMQKIPAKCSMYDLLNFTTEVATHYCDTKDGRLLQAEVGNFVSSEYDLEGTIPSHPQFTDWFTSVN